MTTEKSGLGVDQERSTASSETTAERPDCECGHPASYHINFVGEGKPKPPGPPNCPRKQNFCRHPTRHSFCPCRDYAPATDYDNDFWATVARDGQGFVRTQEEWDTLAAYARGLKAESDRVWEFVAMGREITPEAFSDLRSPALELAVDRSRSTPEGS